MSKPIKFSFQKYTLTHSSYQLHKQFFTSSKCLTNCICLNYNQNKTFQCFKCKQKIHICIKIQINRLKINSFQCASCLAKSLDLVYKPSRMLLETYYKTQNIFQKANQIVFQFNLKYQETRYPVDIRGFKGFKTELNWPMQGEFYLNNSSTPINICKPLKTNSNRKNRKEQPFTIKPQLLKQGKNTLVFKIPKLDRNSFIQNFQYEQSSLYFLGIYSVKQLSSQQITSLILSSFRHQKPYTLSLLTQLSQDLQISKNKIKFIDPYTCERISFPVRGRYCNHLTAVCLLIFIQIQKSTRTWKCPICSEAMNQPYVDMWMYQMLKQNPQGEGVYIYANGMYEWEQKEISVLGLDDSQDKSREMIKMNNNQQLMLDNVQDNYFINNNKQSEPQFQLLNIIDNDNNDVEFINLNNNNNRFQSIQLQQQQQYQQPIQIDIQDYYPQNNQKSYKFGQQAEQIQNQPQQINQQQQRIQQQNFLQQFPFTDNNYHESSKFQQAKKKALQKQKQKLSASLLNKTQPQSNASIYSELNNSKLNVSQDQINKIKKNLKGKDAQKVQEFLTFKMLEKDPRQKNNNNNNNVNNNLQLSSESNIKKKQFISGNKRIIDRPSFVQQLKQQQKIDINKKNDQQNKNISFGKLKKRIETSQMKPPSFVNNNQIPIPSTIKSKSQPKKQFQFTNLSSRTVKVQSNYFKNNQIKIKQNSFKGIKPLVFQQISHNHFLKKYCRIPLNPYGKIMNQDMKKVFKMIL